ncbi:MAG TPA: hypothetical protein VFW94_21035 [Candidatus Acidoferrales bacterium]|nr:hypothetical protein [Candidatus Acidoferrales bacterium]
MTAYRETLQAMYSSNAGALKSYAEWLGISEDKARRVRDEFFPQKALDPNKIVGLDTIVQDAVALKYTSAALTNSQLADLVQISAPIK